MAWHSPRTWASGEFWTAALVNEQLRDNLLALSPVIGELKMFVRPPSAIETVIGLNWLECNGAVVSRANYASLFNLFNGMRSVWGSGSTTLTAAITSSQTSISIAAYPDAWPGGRQSYLTADHGWNSGYSDFFEIQIDSERMLVTDKGAYPYTTLQVLRGREATLAAGHNAGAGIFPAANLPFGNGDGVTTFTLPDLHGRTVFSAARPGGHVDMTTVGKNDQAGVGARRSKHRHSWETISAGSPGSQVNWAAGTLGSGQVDWTSGGGDWPYQNYGMFVGPLDEGGARAINTTPLNAPGYVVTGVWGIRFVG